MLRKLSRRRRRKLHDNFNRQLKQIEEKNKTLHKTALNLVRLVLSIEKELMPEIPKELWPLILSKASDIQYKDWLVKHLRNIK
jgi:hypothetical protein